MGQAHGVTPTTPVSADDARHVARVMGALATPSRVRILARLREGPSSVGDLATAVQMEQPAVSHQLRILRDLGLLVGSRTGRHVIYGLHDPHLATLLDEALRHIEHLRTGAAEPPRAPISTATSKGASMTEEHTHDAPHAHEHSHEDVTHSHAHTAHHHEHVEHEHDHEHRGDKHAHPHVHEAGLEDVHEHDHA